MSGPSIAVVGAGVSGCYAAQALRKELPDAEITVIERLPVPFGLLRYGVAPDHQGTKGVQQQFERVFARGDVAFVGGLGLGRDFSLSQLRQMFDVVVLATGTPDDRRLGVAGDTLAGVVGAGRLTRALNSHPEDCATPPVVAPSVAIVGSGNVAVDLLRLLSKTRAEWDGSDMDEQVLARIIPHPVTEIHLVSRSTAQAARWDAAMVKELATLRRPAFRLITGAIAPAPAPAARALCELIDTTAPRSADLVVNLHFACVVEEVIGQDRVAGLRLLSAAGERLDIGAATVLTAIGFDWRPCEATKPGVYTTGWLRTGPQGAISYQRTLAKQLAAEIVADIRSGLISPGRPGRSALPTAARTTDFDGWRRIDDLERARAAAGRARRKIIDMEEMYAVAAVPPTAAQM